jgi:hypothetical protein
MQIHSLGFSFSGVVQTINESLSSVGERMKAVALTALLALSFLAACYYIYRRCLFRGSVDNDQDFNRIPLLRSTLIGSPRGSSPSRIRLDVEKFLHDFKSRISVPQNCISAKYFITIEDKEQGAIRKEFIFASSDGEVFDKKFLDMQLDKVVEYFKSSDMSTKKIIGINSYILFMTMAADSKLKYHMADFFSQVVGTKKPSRLSEASLEGGGLDAFDVMLQDGLDFPKEQQVDNGKFCRGRFFQVLS